MASLPVNSIVLRKATLFVSLIGALISHLAQSQSTPSKQTLRQFTMQASVLVNENGDRLSDPAYRPPVHSMSKEFTDKHQVLLKGGVFKESEDTVESWLEYLTNLQDL